MKKIFLTFLITILLTTAICPAVTYADETAPRYQCLVLHRNNGDTWRQYRLTGRSIKLPAVRNAKGYTFLGWSDKAGQTRNPKYQPGQMVRFSRTTHLYAVQFDHASEMNIPDSKLLSVYPKKYDRVIFVGDSRTVQISKTFERGLGYVPENVTVIAQNGRGLEWFKRYAWRRLKYVLSKEKGRTAVVFNLGINDLKHTASWFVSCDKTIRDYMYYMPKVARYLKRYNCKLYYMSVNPINSPGLTVPYSRKESEVLKFNKAMKQLKDYEYIDTHSYMIRNGFSMNVLDTGFDDAVHYSAKTIKRIYCYCMKQLAK